MNSLPESQKGKAGWCDMPSDFPQPIFCNQDQEDWKKSIEERISAIERLLGEWDSYEQEQRERE